MEPQEFYTKLEKRLKETTEFPSKYLYKFIVPTKGNGVEEIEELFNNLGAVITTERSRKGTYTSISILLKVDSAEWVIEKYKEVAKIKGVISL